MQRPSNYNLTSLTLRAAATHWGFSFHPPSAPLVSPYLSSADLQLLLCHFNVAHPLLFVCHPPTASSYDPPDTLQPAPCCSSPTYLPVLCQEVMAATLIGEQMLGVWLALTFRWIEERFCGVEIDWQGAEVSRWGAISIHYPSAQGTYTGQTYCGQTYTVGTEELLPIVVAQQADVLHSYLYANQKCNIAQAWALVCYCIVERSTMTKEKQCNFFQFFISIPRFDKHKV